MARTLAAPLALLLLVVSCAPQAVRADEVRIFDDPAKPEKEWGYDPAWIRVPVGTTVTFTNAGVVYHTVTSSEGRVIIPLPTSAGASPAAASFGRAFDVGASPAERVTIHFDTVGRFEYHCGVHPDMRGVVEVCDGACR